MAIYYKDRFEWIKNSVESTITSCGNYLKNFIVVLDGPVEKQIEEYLKNINKMKIYKLKKNMGLSYALNYGLSFCSSEYVARMDADDICLPNRFKDQINKIYENDCDIITGLVIENNQKSSSKKLIKSNNLYIANTFNHPTVIFKKEKIDALGGYRHIRFFEDYDLWLRAKKNNFHLEFMNEFLVEMRFDDLSLKRRTGIYYMLFEIVALKTFFFNDRLIPFKYLPIWIIRIFIRVLPINIYYLIRKKIFR